MKTTSKKAQITIFIIIGVVLVSVLGGYFIVKGTFSSNKYEPKINVLKDNILDCFKGKYENALEIIAYQGGYSEKPSKETYQTPTIFVPYYYYEGQDLLPTIRIIEDEIGKESQKTISTCIESYQEENPTFQLSHRNFEVFTKIEQKEVIFTTNMKLTVDYDNKTVIIEFIDFEVDVDSKLYDMYEVAKVIVNQATSDPQEWIGITEIYDEVNQRELNATILELAGEPSSTIFIISTNEQSLHPYRFQFINKYNLYDIGFPQGLSSE